MRSAFAMRRKTLANNLIASFGLDREAAEGVILSCGLKPAVRGEALSLENLARVADKIYEIKSEV